VDDEPLVLRGIRRLLFAEASDWEMVFVESGERALDELVQTPFDVLLTDMRMPGLDGLTLLRRAHAVRPEMIRIAISGHLDEETALRALAISHQFIAKPCSRETLLGALERAIRVQQVMGDPAMRRVLGGVLELPSRPAVYVELTERLTDEDASVDEVAAIVERDLALTAKVLHVVNSAFLAPVQRITTVRAAVARIGLRRIKFLVLAAEVFQAFKGREPPGWSLDALFERSLLVGELAAELAGPDRRLAEDAFLAGVLHDMGQLILLGRLPDRLEAALAESRRTGEPLHVVERRQGEVTHAEIGAYLLGLWGLPYDIIDAVACHHSPERLSRPAAGGPQVATALLLAGVLVDEALAAHHGNAPGDAVNEQLAWELGLVGFDAAHWRARATAMLAKRLPA